MVRVAVFIACALLGSACFAHKFVPDAKKHDDSHHKARTENAERKSIVFTAIKSAVGVGKFLQEVVISLQTNYLLAVGVSNTIVGTELVDPAWYVEHGDITGLMPYQVQNSGEESNVTAVFSHEQTLGLGTAGMFCYRFGKIGVASKYLVVFWKIPFKYDPTSHNQFFVEIVSGKRPTANEAAYKAYKVKAWKSHKAGVWKMGGDKDGYFTAAMSNGLKAVLQVTLSTVKPTSGV